jgi:hypothetical protein
MQSIDDLKNTGDEEIKIEKNCNIYFNLLNLFNFFSLRFRSFLIHFKKDNRKFKKVKSTSKRIR